MNIAATNYILNTFVQLYLYYFAVNFDTALSLLRSGKPAGIYKIPIELVKNEVNDV